LEGDVTRQLSDPQLNSIKEFLRWLDTPKIVELAYGNFFKALAEKFCRSRKNEERYPFDVRTLTEFAAWVNERLYSDSDDDEFESVYFTHNDYPTLEAAIETMVEGYISGAWDQEGDEEALSTWAREECP
jgi:hypothetical protein